MADVSRSAENPEALAVGRTAVPQELTRCIAKTSSREILVSRMLEILVGNA